MQLRGMYVGIDKQWTFFQLGEEVPVSTMQPARPVVFSRPIGMM